MLSLLAMAGKVFLVVFLEQRGSAQPCAQPNLQPIYYAIQLF
jgi:hypothetical protein